MKPEIKAAWLAALRSGEYKQTQGILRDNNSYCRLGALCDLAAKEGIGKWEQDGAFTVDNDRRTALLPPWDVATWAGLNSSNPTINMVGITAYNDGDEGERQHTFAEIADLIEQYL